MASINNTPRPAYVYDTATNEWIPIGVGAHSHNEIPKTVVDAKGDLIVGTAADEVNRLAVGSANQVLTVDSSTSTGLKWATPSGAENMAQIATGTLSGASVTISNLSNYDDLFLTIYQTTNNTADGLPKLRINNNSGANYSQFGTFHDASSFQAYNVTGNDAILLSSNNVGRTVNANVFVIKLTNCKQAGFTDWDCFTRMYDGNNKAYFHKGIYAVSEAVSSLVILNTGGTWSAGTYTLWGA